MAAAYEHGHHVLGPEAARGYRGGDAVGEGVGLSVCERDVFVTDRGSVGILLRLAAEQADDGLRGIDFLSVMVEAVQLRQALAVGERYGMQAFVLQQAAHDALHGVGEGLHQGGAVFAVVVAEHDGLLSLAAVDIDAEGELRRAGLHILARNLLAINPIVRQYADLVGQHHLGLEAELVGDLGERILLMTESGLEVLVALPEEGFGIVYAAVSSQGQGVDEHSETVGRTEIAAAIADGADIDLLAGAVGAQGQVCGGQVETGGRYAQPLAERVYVSAHGLLEEDLTAGLVAGVKVRNDGRGAFQPGQLPGEELPGLGIGLAALGGLLPGGVLEVGITLRSDLLAFKGGADILYEEVVTAAVEHQVVEVAQKVGLAITLKDFQFPERSCGEVEGLHEVFLFLLQIAVEKDAHRHGNVVRDLIHFPFSLLEAGLEYGMGVEDLEDRLLKGSGLHFPGESPHHRNVVDRLVRGLHTVDIHARLLVGKRLGAKDFGHLGFGRALPFQEFLQDLVLYVLYGGGLGEGIHIGLDAETLEEFGGQAQAAERTEPVEHQRFVYRRAFDACGLLKDGHYLFLQYVQRSGLLLGLARLRLRQGLLVHFLIDIQRDGVYLHRDRRHHIRRLALHYESVERRRVDGPVAHDVGGEELAAALLIEGLHGNVLDAGELPDDRLHFLQFYPEAADLDLGVLAAYVLDVTVGAVAHDVAGAVRAPEFGIGLEGIVDEALGGLVGTAQIAVADLQAGLQQFACGSYRHPPAGLVHDECVDARQRLANGDVLLLAVHILGDDVADALRGAVAVEESIFRQRQGAQFLAAGIQHLQALATGIVDGELGGHLRGHETVGDAVGLEVSVKRGEVQANGLRNEVQRSAGHERGEQVADECVEAETGVCREPARGRDAGALAVMLSEHADIAVVEHAALGRARGAAGVQEDEEAVGPGLRPGLALGQSRDVGRGQDRPLEALDQLRQALICDEHGAGGVLHHELQPVLRIGRVERLVTAAGLEHAQRGYHRVFAPAQDDGDHAPGLDGLFNVSGEPVGEAVDLGIGQAPVVKYDGGVLRVFRDPAAEQVQDGLLRLGRGLPGIEAVQGPELRGAGEVHLPHGIGLPEGKDGRGHALCETSQDLLRILAGTVPESHPVGALDGREELCGKGKSGGIGTKVFADEALPCQFQHGLGEHELALEAEIDARSQAEVGAAVGHREETPRPEPEGLGLHPLQDVRDRGIRGGAEIGREGMHAHREGGALGRGLAAVPDGGETGGTVGVPGRKGQAEHRREEYAVGVAVALGDPAHRGAVQIEVDHQLLECLLLRAIDVGDDAALGLGRGSELLREPLLCLLESLALAFLLLLQGNLGPAHLLGGDLPALISGAQVVENDGNTGSVGNDMVEIHIEIIRFGSPVQLEAEKAVLAQVHRLREALPDLVYAVNLLDFRGPRLVAILHAGHAVLLRDARLDVRMRSDEGLEGVFQSVQVDTVGEPEQHCLLVISGFVVKALAGQIHAQLSLGEW